MRTHAALLLALAACETTHADPAPTYDHDAMVRFHMRDHYDMLRAIEHLVIRDDLYDVKVIARSIGDGLDEPGLERWKSQVGFARANARELASAPSNDEACWRTARLAATCANCHIDAHVDNIFSSPPPKPPDGTALDARMARHVWAADRLFDGVIGGANDSWRSGLDVLAETPPPFSVLDTDRVALAARLQDLADQTRKHAAKDDFAARAHAFGEILVTCSACHTADRRSVK